MSNTADPVSDRPEEQHHELPATAGLITWLLAGLIVLVSAILLYLTVPACGVRLLGNTVVFPWCEPRLAALDMLETEQERRAALKNQIHTAELALLDPDLCGPPVQPMPAPTPPEEMEAPAEEAEAPVEEPEPIAQDQTEICEPDQVFQPPEEVALVVDGSGSMRFAADIPDPLLQEYAQARRQLKSAQNSSPLGDFQAMFRIVGLENQIVQIENRMDRVAGPSRAAVARDILTRTVQEAPAGLPIDLTIFTSCNNINSQSYTSNNRPELLQRISRLRPEEGTPLARSMRIAANNLEGGDDPNDPVTMVVISDGDDSCGGDPCAMARQIKEQKPGLIINLLDLSQNDELRCVAEATGGTFRRGSGDVAELTEILQESAGYSGAGQCRPATPSEEDPVAE